MTGSASKVRALPEDVAARIAAGEVVERPASVVKELVENSLDAGATQVEISTEAGGKGLIRVADDGHGMYREDAILALERHTTSKISEIEDLDKISTLGFRGEALFAISAVSRFGMLTRREEDSTGTRIWVEGGEVVEISDAPRQRGTTIEARDLFFNLPARRRFLRSNNTELGHVVKVVEWYLLTQPQVGISLVNDDSEVFTHPPGSWESRVASCWDVETGDLIPLDFRAAGIRVEGFLTRPPVAFRNRSKILFAVNGHPVQDSVISAAVRQAMEGHLPKGHHPGLLLVLTMPPSEVDVNVHPAKREVRFRNGQKVFAAVLNALNSALEPAGTWGQTGTPLEEETKIPDLGERGTVYGASSPQSVGPVVGSGFKPQRGTPMVVGKRQEGLVEHAGMSQGLFEEEWAYLGEVEGVYLIFETPEKGLVVVDKHACHERMLYDEIVKGQRPPVHLLTPIEIPLSAQETEAAETNRELLESLGFNFEADHGKVVLKVVPFWARECATRGFIKALELKGGSQRREVLARWACRAAVKAGEVTGIMDVKTMASWLRQAGENVTCPHGRPVVVRLTKEALERLFKRRT